MLLLATFVVVVFAFAAVDIIESSLFRCCVYDVIGGYNDAYDEDAVFLV